MTIRTELDVEEMKGRLETLEKALAARAQQEAHGVGVATKDDLDALLARLRAFEGDLAALKKRVKF